MAGNVLFRLELSCSALRRAKLGRFAASQNFEGRRVSKRVEDLQEFIETFSVICPACKGQVRAAEGAIKCLECRRVYTVRDGIPALVVEEATVEDEESPQTA